MKKEPFRCPVCCGNGLVPNGFYSYTAGFNDYTTSSIVPETCKSCNGTGIVWSNIDLKELTNEDNKGDTP